MRRMENPPATNAVRLYATAATQVLHFTSENCNNYVLL